MKSQGLNSPLLSQQTRRLLRQAPSVVNKLLAKAATYYEKGDLDQAETCYRQVLAEDPQHSDALHLLGLVFAARKNYEEAISLISQAISHHPQIVVYRSNRAALYQTLGRHREAVTDFYHVVQADPKQPGVWIKLGNSLLALEKISGAMDAYQKALALQPDHYYTHQMIGDAWLAKEDYEEARVAFEQALRLKPDSAEILASLASVLLFFKQHDEAINYYERALAIQPENAIICFNLAVALGIAGQYEAAEQRYHQVIALKPDFIAAYINLWMFCRDQGRHEEAADHLQQANRIHLNHPDIIWNEAFILLQQGDFAEGWKKYEIRLQTLKEHKKRVKPQVPRWQGESFVGKTLLIHTEQGLGDTLQFIRYLPLVKQRGGRIVVECQRELLNLFKACYRDVVDIWIPWDGTPPVFDYYIELLSLPLIYQTDLSNIPFPSGYLQPPLNMGLIDKIRGLSNKPKIGLVWAGNPIYKADAARSMSLAQYKPILALKEFTFCSLQWGKKGLEDIANQPLNDQLINLAAECNDFLDTATAVTELDLVITSDTSMAHLVGALGQKAWILLSASSDFRWLLQRKDSPWYDSLKLFRQPEAGDWGTVIQSVIAELTT